jgi:alpha-L-fucosidase
MINRRNVLILVVISMILPASLMAVASKKTVKGGERLQVGSKARMKWWRDAKFGMFIHWGLYSIPAGEWKGKEIYNLIPMILKLSDGSSWQRGRG